MHGAICCTNASLNNRADLPGSDLAGLLYQESDRFKFFKPLTSWWDRMARISPRFLCLDTVSLPAVWKPPKLKLTRPGLFHKTSLVTKRSLLPAQLYYSICSVRTKSDTIFSPDTIAEGPNSVNGNWKQATYYKENGDLNLAHLVNHSF